MNWLDKTISFLSPEWGARREAWRQNLELMRSYDAGSTGRLNAGWNVNNQSAEVTDKWQRDIIRARARDLERNSDVMNSILGAYKRNVVGFGFRLQAMTGDEALNEQIEHLWLTWTRKENCDVTGTQSFTQMLRMLVARKKVDGGILIVKRYVDAWIPFQLQLLEVDELDGGYEQSANRDTRVVGGVEYNRYNRPVGYWVRQYQIDGTTEALPVYIPASEVIFYYTKKRPSQIREVSDMSQTLSRIRDLNEFITAVSVKQRIQACLSVFIKKSLPPVGLGRSGGAAQERFSYDGKTLTPGMIKELNAGDDVQTVNPTGQSADATSFTKLQQRMIGAGQGISYEATSRDMSESTYSSARQGLIEDDLTFQEEVEQLVAVMDEIYQGFLEACIMSGALAIADYYANQDAYLTHEWIRQPKAWIDPQKEAQATMTALSYGIKTFKEVASENGHDWRAQIDDIAEVNDYAKAKGINLEGVLFGGKAVFPPDPGQLGSGTDDGDEGVKRGNQADEE